MRDYFAIFQKEEKFCPSWLEGILHTEFFEKEPFEHKDSDFIEREIPADEEAVLPEAFWFITSDRKYGFDFRAYSGDSSGFLVSLEFLNLLQKYNTSAFQFKEMNIVNKRKDRVSSKDYFYVRFYRRIANAIDMEKSNIELYRSGQSAGQIKKIWDLQLKSTLDFPDVFLLKETKLSTTLLCSEEFRTEAENLKLKGIVFVSANQADVYKPY
jgi:hypothetical protein